MAIEEDSLVVVVTSVQGPTASMRRLASRLAQSGSALIVIGDRRSPDTYALDGCRFLSLADQALLPHRVQRLLPTGHYARKNLGYLEAMAAGAGCIYETDDDNAPSESWRVRPERVEAVALNGHKWVNSYRALSGRHIWPRGFPLRFVQEPTTWATSAAPSLPVRSSVQQAMADGSPDVDAVWRLVIGGEFSFPPGPSRLVPPRHWHPFNSQSTWWWPLAYPLLYLPTTCSFRNTDIWRSLVAQRCLWEVGQGVVHHPPEVVQERNEHNLLKDFADEVQGYLRNEEIAELLEGLSLLRGEEHMAANLHMCYEALCRREVLASEEMTLLEAWLQDVAQSRSRKRGTGPSTTGTRG